MGNKTVVQLPQIDNIVLNRVLTEIITQLNTILGYNGDSKYINSEDLYTTINNLIAFSEDAKEQLVYSDILSYEVEVNIIEDLQIPYKKFNDSSYTYQTSNDISKLNQVVSDPPTKVEVQAISDKVDAILLILSANKTLNLV